MFGQQLLLLGSCGQVVDVVFPNAASHKLVFGNDAIMLRERQLKSVARSSEFRLDERPGSHLGWKPRKAVTREGGKNCPVTLLAEMISLARTVANRNRHC